MNIGKIPGQLVSGAKNKFQNVKIILPNRVKKFATASSAEQRAVMGITAIVSQPVIDYFNPSVDKDTRNYSVARDAVKIIIGTGVGVPVRAATVGLARKLVDSGILKSQKSEIMHNAVKTEKFIKMTGSTLGIIAVLFTNFLLDMPLCKAGLNFVVDKFNLNPEAKKGKEGE